ncbi:hypothetical protein KPL70_020385 [Citrus sinensis]|nr:hypothetical protein KPL70_020385 [Citrus sinensis]
MNSENPFTVIAPPVFDGTNYQAWAVRMEAYLDANDPWEAIEQIYEVPPLLDNPTLAQIRNQKDMKQGKSKAKATLFTAVSSTNFSRIMTLKTAKEIWDFLKQEYEGNERVKGMQVLNLILEFEMQKMKESETIQEYSDRLFEIANKVRLLELLNALHALEQMRFMRQEESVEGAFQAKPQNNKGSKNKKKHNKVNKLGGSASSNKNSQSSNTQVFPTCLYCKKSIIHKISVGGGQMQNVISVLLEKGYKMLFEDKNCVIKYAKDREVFKVQMKGKNFALDLMKEEQAVVYREDSNTMLGHKRLGHFHHIALLYMKKNNLVKSLPKLEEEPPECAAYNWSWENDKKLEVQKENDDTYYENVRGTKSLSDIYKRCTINVTEPAWLDTIRMLLALAAQQGWVIHQMDVKSAFLNGYLEEEIFVEQPEGFIFPGQEEKVYQKQNKIFLCQQKYAKEVIKKFNMEECKPTATPMNQKEKFCKEDKVENVDERLLARGGKKMAAREVKHNRKQCNVAAVVRATSAIAFWKQ